MTQFWEFQAGSNFNVCVYSSSLIIAIELVLALKKKSPNAVVALSVSFQMAIPRAKRENQLAMWPHATHPKAIGGLDGLLDEYYSTLALTHSLHFGTIHLPHTHTALAFYLDTLFPSLPLSLLPVWFTAFVSCVMSCWFIIELSSFTPYLPASTTYNSTTRPPPL